MKTLKNCHMAVEKVLEHWREDHKTVLDADISGFFDNIPHQVILEGPREEVADGNLLDIIEKFLAAGVMENGGFKPTTMSTPQDKVISPLLTNIALDSMGWMLDRNGPRCVRYADDFVIPCHNKPQAEEALTLVAQHLNALGLRLSPEKAHIASFKEGFTFLGFDINSYKKIGLSPLILVARTRR